MSVEVRYYEHEYENKTYYSKQMLLRSGNHVVHDIKIIVVLVLYFVVRFGILLACDFCMPLC